MTLSAQTTVTGFFDAIAAGCSSNSLSFSGGYNSTAERLELNIAIELSASRNLQAALRSLQNYISIPIDPSFFEELSVLDDIELGGSLLLDLTIGASIPIDEVKNGTFSNVGLFVEINAFSVEAFLTAPDLNLDLPVSLPDSGVAPATELIFFLEGGNFDLSFSIELMESAPVSLGDLFSNNTNIEINGTLDASFPVGISTNGAEFGVTLLITDEDLLSSPPPFIDYEIDM